MSSIQERLQLKRVPLDTWNIREKLCLASAVVRSGDQNWMSVSRSLKTIGDPNRPADWYSQKSCAAQYGALLEHVETPKRKKRSSEGAAETPQESILKRLTQERINEIQESVAEINRQYETLKNEITEARNPTTSEDRLREMWTEIEASKRARERETARRAAWLKEREEKRARAERTWRPPVQPQTAGVATTPSSPLLTSLLKSSPVVTTPQSITHPANVIETISPSAGAPTLSMLLESRDTMGSTGPDRSASPDTKHAAIEHIKSQLVQIERQLKEQTSTPPPAALPPAPPAPAVDIDDIEIKAEDVYAFRDIDLHIPPVTTMHKGSTRPPEKAVLRKDEPEPVSVPNATMAIETETVVEPPAPVEEIKEEPVPLAPPIEDPVIPEPLPAPSVEPDVQTEESEAITDADELRIGFPTPEIKVIPSEEQLKTAAEDPAAGENVAVEVEKDVNLEVDDVVEDTSTREQEPVELEPAPEVTEEVTPSATAESLDTAVTLDTAETDVTAGIAPEVEDNVEVTAAAAVETEDIPLPESVPEFDTPTPEIPLPPEEDSQEEREIKQELIEETTDIAEEKQIEPETAEPEVAESPPRPEVEIKEDDEVPKTSPAPETMQEESAPELTEPEPELAPAAEVKNELPAEVEETHTETDDDTPMELSREEENTGKKRRDYSRKKKTSSRTCSGSESAEASAPESPGVGPRDGADERQHRLWKKSVMLVYSRLCAHKYASLFLRPISDDEAPGYSVVVKRPMDLSAIRKHIEGGTVRTTEEFHRDVLLMLTNALMYNSSEHSVYGMAKEMMDEAQNQLSMLLAAQAHADLEPTPPARRKRRRPASPPPTVAKRPR